MGFAQETVKAVANTGVALTNRVTTLAPRVVEGAEHSLGHNAAVAVSSALPNTFAEVVGFGLTAAINASFSQASYNKHRRHIIKFYSDEFSAKLGKSSKELNKKDLDALARGDEAQGVEANRTVAQEIAKAKRKRNLGIGLAVIATLGTFMLLHPVMTALSVETAFQALAAGAGVGKILAEAVVGVAIFHLIKDPLHWVADKIFGAEPETAHDRIVSIQKDHALGKEITKERILSVFIAVDPELDKSIEASYGRRFDLMPTADQRYLVKEAERVIPLDTIAAALNAGKMNPTELAFTVDGQVSGFIPELKQPEQPGFFARIKQKLFGGGKKTEYTSIVPRQEHSAPLAPAEEVPQPSHVDRLGYRKANVDMGHVERIEQARAAENPLLAQR